MKVNYSLFDFIAYIIPGLIYLASFIIISTNFIDASIPSLLKTIDLTQSVILTIVAYILGLLFSSVAVRFPPNCHLQEKKELIKIDQRNYLPSKYKNIDWNVLQAKIESAHTEVAKEIKNHEAKCKLFENLSFALLLLFISIYTLFWTSILTLTTALFLFAVAIGFSLISAYESIKFYKWRFSRIQEHYRADEVGD